ncbi:MAG: TIGR03032 family protein [Leptospirales bacterium]
MSLSQSDGIKDDNKPASEATAENEFRVHFSRGFPTWLLEEKISLAISTYQAGKIILVGFNTKGEVSIVERSISRCMGIAADKDAQNLYVAGISNISRFVNAIQAGQQNPDHDRIYIPQATYTTGDIDTHDMAVDKDGRLIFTNTLFSCLCTLSATHSFVPIWQPPFITDLLPEDRCHMNGFCLNEKGEPGYVTAVAETNLSGAWRDNRRDGGIVIDVQKNKIITTGLSMPHSPRMHNGKLYIQNAGTGHLGTVDLKSGKFKELVFLPGFLRGLSFSGNFAICGVSKKRKDRSFQGLELDENLQKHKVSAKCGIYIIDLKTGANMHHIEFEGLLEELYDVQVLSGVQRPNIIGFMKDEIKRMYVVGENQDNLKTSE